MLTHSQGSGLINTHAVTSVHNHIYGEVHVIAAGTAVFTVDGVRCTAGANCAVLIPPKKYHAVEAEGGGLVRVVFQTDCKTDQAVCKDIPGGMVAHLMERIQVGEGISSLYNSLFFILSELLPGRNVQLTPLQDDRLQIREFFSLNYNRNIHLSDLAAELHLSQMQTQRVVKKYTGRTFGENLLRQRMKVAENLMKTSEMSLTEISEYVGYNSYGGFWKAYRKFKEIGKATDANVFPDPLELG